MYINIDYAVISVFLNFHIQGKTRPTILFCLGEDTSSQIHPGLLRHLYHPYSNPAGMVMMIMMIMMMLMMLMLMLTIIIIIMLVLYREIFFAKFRVIIRNFVKFGVSYLDFFSFKCLRDFDLPIACNSGFHKKNGI